MPATAAISSMWVWSKRQTFGSPMPQTPTNRPLGNGGTGRLWGPSRFPGGPPPAPHPRLGFKCGLRVAEETEKERKLLTIFVHFIISPPSNVAPLGRSAGLRCPPAAAGRREPRPGSEKSPANLGLLDVNDKELVWNICRQHGERKRVSQICSPHFLAPLFFNPLLVTTACNYRSARATTCNYSSTRVTTACNYAFRSALKRSHYKKGMITTACNYAGAAPARPIAGLDF